MALPQVIPAIGDVIQTRVYIVQAEQTAINIRHWRCVGITGSGVTLTEFVTAFSQGVGTIYGGVISQLAAYYGADAMRVWPLPRTIPYIAKGVAIPGEDTTGLLPRQDAAVITFLTGLPGRKFRGRMYVPFPPISSSGPNGIPTAAYLNLLTPLATYYATTETTVGVNGTATFVPTLFHREDGSDTTIAQYIVRQKFGTQRRRGTYGRPNPPPF